MKVELADDGTHQLWILKWSRGKILQIKEIWTFIRSQIAFISSSLGTFCVVFLNLVEKKNGIDLLLDFDNLEDDSQGYSRRNGR